jgi:uncharacterized membrane protein
MKTTTKKRIKTTAFWGGLASAIILFAQNIGMLLGYEIPAVTVSGILASVNSLLAVLSFSGVLVNSKEVDSFQAMVKKKK